LRWVERLKVLFLGRPERERGKFLILLLEILSTPHLVTIKTDKLPSSDETATGGDAKHKKTEKERSPSAAKGKFSRGREGTDLKRKKEIRAPQEGTLGKAG